MTTFSSLPTSHFTLRPSSSDAELEQSPTQFWNQTSFGYKSNSEEWNWNQTGSDRESWQRKSSGEQISGISSSSTYPHPSPAPSNFGSSIIGSTNSSRCLSAQQQVGTTDQETSAGSTNKKEMSRSSLSVTDSKTIVLTNSPGPWRALTDKKKEMEKVLSQQNHKLVNNVSSKHKLRTEEEQEGKHKKPRMEEGGNASDAKTASSADKAEIGGASSNPTIKSERKDDATKTGVSLENSGSGGDSVGLGTKHAESSQGEGGGTLSSSSAVTSAGVSTGVSSSPPSTATENVSDSAAPPGKKDADKADESATAEPQRVPVPSPKVVDVWKMRGPSNGILAFNTHKSAKKDKVQPKKKTKNSLVGFNLESARLVTTQFAAKAVKRKEDGVSVGGLGGGDIVPPLGGILVRGATTGNRSGSSTPTVLGATVDMTTQQIFPGIGAIGAATISSLGVGRLSAELQATPMSKKAGAVISQPLQENMVIAKGVEVKRTNSIGSDSVGVHVTLSSQSSGGLTAHHPTGSAGTNGTDFQEIFNSKRKLSENSERGLKQALAG